MTCHIIVHVQELYGGEMLPWNGFLQNWAQTSLIINFSFSPKSFPLSKFQDHRAIGVRLIGTKEAIKLDLIIMLISNFFNKVLCLQQGRVYSFTGILIFLVGPTSSSCFSKRWLDTSRHTVSKGCSAKSIKKCSSHSWKFGPKCNYWCKWSQCFQMKNNLNCT